MATCMSLMFSQHNC